MNSTTDKDKLIRVSAGTYKLLTKQAALQGVSYKELIHLMVTYFQITKANPADPQADLPGLGIKKLTEKVEALDKRFIGFVREQEKELLKPILSEVKATRSQLTPMVNPVTAADLDKLAGRVYMMFGQVLEANQLKDQYIEKFNKALSSKNP
jgi:hypothetical protein